MINKFHYCCLSILFTLIQTSCTHVVEKNVPQIKFQSDNYDFGDVKHEGEVSCTFVYENTGMAPLVIDHVSSSCGCTTTDWSDSPLLPGERQSLKVHFDAAEPGPFRKTIVVYSNSNTMGSTILHIKGNVK